MFNRVKSLRPIWTDEQVELEMSGYKTLPDGTITRWLSRRHHMMILQALWNQSCTALLESLSTPMLIAIADLVPPGRKPTRYEVAEALQARRPETVRWRRFNGSMHDIHIDQPKELVQWILSAVDEGFFG